MCSLKHQMCQLDSRPMAVTSPYIPKSTGEASLELRERSTCVLVNGLIDVIVSLVVLQPWLQPTRVQCEVREVLRPISQPLGNRQLDCLLVNLMLIAERIAKGNPRRLLVDSEMRICSTVISSTGNTYCYADTSSTLILRSKC